MQPEPFTDIAGGREKLETLFDVTGLEAENLFDMLLMHDDKADAVHQAETPIPQVHPDRVGLLVNGLVDPVHVHHSQDVLAPQLGGIEPDAVLQHGHGLRRHIICGH